MPVLHIRALPVEDARVARLLTSTAEATAAVLGCDPHEVWCTFTALQGQSLGSEVYLARAGEASTTGTTAPPASGPIAYVDLWLRPRSGDLDQSALAAACEAVASALEHPVDDVWGALLPAEPGRVFAGGGIIGR